MTHIKWMGIITIASVVLLGCQAATQNNTDKSESAVASANEASAEIFPDFKVKSLDGKEKALRDYKGKIVILDLFATWCPPCRMEIPHFVNLQNKYRDTLSVVGLSYDQSPAETVKKFMAEMKINYDVYWGSEEIAGHVGLRGIPHTLVLDQEQRVVKSYVGYQDESVFENEIKALQGKAGDETKQP